jgi:hypothetical protein
MNTETIDNDLRALLRRLKLGKLLDTMPERLALARQQKMPHQDFLVMLLSDEASRRDANAATVRAQRAHLEPDMQIERWDETAKVCFETVVCTNCTPDGNGSLSRSRCIHEEGSHRVMRGVNERRPSVNERRPTVWWARKRGVRRGLDARAVLGAHVCRGTRSSHRGGGHGPKSKSCCGGPLAGRMGSR